MGPPVGGNRKAPPQKLPRLKRKSVETWYKKQGKNRKASDHTHWKGMKRGGGVWGGRVPCTMRPKKDVTEKSALNEVWWTSQKKKA